MLGWCFVSAVYRVFTGLMEDYIGTSTQTPHSPHFLSDFLYEKPKRHNLLDSIALPRHSCNQTTFAGSRVRKMLTNELKIFFWHFEDWFR